MNKANPNKNYFVKSNFHERETSKAKQNDFSGEGMKGMSKKRTNVTKEGKQKQILKEPVVQDKKRA